MSVTDAHDDPGTETVAEIAAAALAARRRAHWGKFTDLHAEIHSAESQAEIAELARQMAAELHTYAIYVDAGARQVGAK